MSIDNKKKLNILKNEIKFFFLKFERFYENHPPTRHIKYKKIDFATIIISIMAFKLS